MSAHDELRRALHEALPVRPGYPSRDLLDRIMADVGASPRATGRAHALGRTLARAWARLAWNPRLMWLPPVAALALVAVLAQVLVGQRAPAPAYAGRVEFLATTAIGHVEFLSSQAHLANEYRAMTDDVLAGFHGVADFNSQPTASDDVARILYEQAAGRSTVDLVALTRGDMAALETAGALEDLTPLLRRLQADRQFPASLLDGGGPDAGRQYAIPWLQATYLLVVNRLALAYLPPGADVNHLTYDQLVDWGRRMEASGRPRIGLPAGDTGLIHRFLQGYAYPSFTGTTLTGFRSPAAVRMWQTLDQLWSVTDPASTTYSGMDDALQSGDIWVAWDHQARVSGALADGGRFIAVPAPSGPAGLGSMTAVVDLAIPKNAPNRKGAEALVEWLTRPRQQLAASSSLHFTPVVQGLVLSGPVASEWQVARSYRSDPNAVATQPPVGLGADAESFSAVYRETFARIVLQHQDMLTVLNEESAKLQQLVDHAGAPCWPPDRFGSGPCHIA